MTALDQSESRAALSSRALIKLNFDVGAFSQDEAERLQLWLNSVDASQPVLMPLWIDRVFLSDAVEADALAFGLEEGDALALESGDGLALEQDGIPVEGTAGFLFAQQSCTPFVLESGDLLCLEAGGDLAFALESGDALELEATGELQLEAPHWPSLRPNLVLWHDYDACEAVTMTRVQPSFITAASPASPYAAGDSAIPGLLGYMHLSQKGTLKTDELLRVGVKFEEVGGDAVGQTDTGYFTLNGTGGVMVNRNSFIGASTEAGIREAKIPPSPHATGRQSSEDRR